MTTKQPNKQSRFPSRCAECNGVVELKSFPYTTKFKHSGKLHEVQVDSLLAPKCNNCGEVYFSTNTETQIMAVLRQQLGLLQPDEIMQGITSTEIRQQRSLAELTGIAAETISRFVNGSVIQSKALDTLLRVVFEFRSVREALRTEREKLGSQMSEDLSAATLEESGTPYLRYLPQEEHAGAKRAANIVQERGTTLALAQG